MALNICERKVEHIVRRGDNLIGDEGQWETVGSCGAWRTIGTKRTLIYSISIKGQYPVEIHLILKV